MYTENLDIVAAILALGVARQGSGTVSPSEIVRHFDQTRDELIRLREAKSRQQLDEWERHAYANDEDKPRAR